MSRQPLAPRRYWLLGILLLLPLASALYWVIQRGKLDAQLATDKTLLTILSATVLLVALALGGLLIRNLARVLSGWRSGVIGSRMQARVALTFLVLTLGPALILSSAAIGIVFRTLRDVTNSDRDRLLSSSLALVEQIEREQSERATQLTDRLSRELQSELADPAVDRDLVTKLERLRVRLGLAAAGVVQADRPAVAVATAGETQADQPRGTELTHLPASVVALALAGKEPFLHTERMPYGWRVISIRPLPEQIPPKAVWGALALPEVVADRLDLIRASAREADELTARRPALQRVYSALFALVTLVVVFVAVWTGFVLARQITDPLLELAAASDALGRGELSTRVREVGQDEISQLARRFNKMASELERARADSIARQRQIETLIESVPVGVVSVDRSGSVALANRTALELLQLDQLPEQTQLVSAWQGRLAQLWAAVEPVVHGQTERIECEVLLDAEGGAVALEVSAIRFVSAAHQVGSLIVLADLTQLRRAERHAAWGEVARRVAHEIKNPLTPIRLSAERLLRRYRTDRELAAGAIEEGVTTIVREVESLRTLVDEFSRFGRLPEIKPQLADLRTVVTDVVSLYEGTRSGVRIETSLPESLPLHRIDVDAMRRALINLLDNALQALPDGGRIELRIRHHTARGTISLECSDNGIGLSAEDLNQLFLPTFSRRVGGTGLGLAIVHRIITEHHGRIRAESQPGTGTRFTIELPIAGAAGETA